MKNPKHPQKDDVARGILTLDPQIVSKQIFAGILGILTGLACCAPAFSNPTGGNVVAGDATISKPNPSTVQINQGSDKAVIDWRSFNIDKHETTRFNQPNKSSITLNRIDPTNGASAILGRLSANGQVWLVNPAGIMFGAGSRVDVGGLLATTASISADDFMSGNYHFVQSPEWRGAIVNEGKITAADRGLVALVAPGVENSGVIQASLGQVVLAAGEGFVIDFYGDRMINFTLDQAVSDQATSPVTGKKMRDAVTNSGKIYVDGGTVLVTAKTAEGVMDRSINMSGYIEAKSAVQQNGSVVLLGDDNAAVEVSGGINVSGKNTAEKGGKVKILGKKILVTDKAKIDASGDQGGGEVLIGGNAHGVGPEKNASYVYFGSDAIVDANALSAGDGGKVILWSDHITEFYGNIFAKGGSQSGHGGFVETSGKYFLQMQGSVDASAKHGKAGEWLLDPQNVTINSSTTTCGTPPCFSAADPTVYTPDTASSNVNVGTINTALNGGTSVTITTGVTGSQAGTITLASGNAISKTSGGDATLTLNAASSITLNSNISSTVGKLNLVLIGDSATIGSTAASAITTNNGDFTATLQNGFTMSTGAFAGTINTGSGKIAINANQDGASTQGVTMNAGSSLTTTSNAADAVLISVNTLSGGTGTASLRNITTGNLGGLVVSTDGLTTNSNSVGNATGGTITLNSGSTLSGGDILLRTAGAVTYSGLINTQGKVTVRANSDGSGASAFTMGSGSSITTASTASDAIQILVNNSAGGTGTATIGDMTTGVGGGITVATDNNANTTGGDILWLSGATSGLNVGAGGTVTLSTAKITNANIGTVALPILMAGQNLNATSGSSGIFVTNSGATPLTVNTLQAVNSSDVATGVAQIISNTAIQEGTNPINITTLTLKTLNNSGAGISFTNSSNKATTINLQARNAADTADANGAISYTDTDGFAISGMNTASSLNLTAGGSITQTGALSVAGLPTLTVTAANSDILLASSANTFGTTPVLATSGSGTIRDFSLRNTATSAVVPTLPTGLRNLVLTFNNNISALQLPTLTLTGTLTATSAVGISQSGAISGTTLTAKTLNDTAGIGVIDLTNSANEFTTINLQTRNAADSADASSNISYNDATGFAVSGLRTAADLYLTGAGALTDSGTMVVGGTAIFDSGGNAVTFNTATNDFNIVTTNSNVSALTLVDINSIKLGNTQLTGALSLTTSGDIQQTSDWNIGGTATFNAGAANNVILDSFTGNNFNSVVITAANDVKLYDTNAISFGASTVSGTFDVTAGGNISQTGALTVTGLPTFTLLSPTTDISLASQANNFNTTPVITNNGNVRDLLLRNTNASAVVPTLPTGLRALTLTFNNASSLLLPALTLTGNLSVTANGPITQSGSLVVNGSGATATFAAGAANDITLDDSSNDFASTLITSGKDVRIRDLNSLILGASTVSGFYNVTTSGAITQSGAQVVTGLTTLDSNANPITLTTSTNNFSSLKITSGSNVGLRDTNALILDGINITGTLSVQTNGLMSQTGAINAGATTLIAGAANDITLNTFENDFSSVAITSGNDVSLRDTNDLALGTSTVSGNLNVSSGGSISQSGILTVTGTPTFTLTNSDSDISLASQANNFSVTPVITNNGNVRDLLIRNVNAGALVPTLPTGLRNLTLTYNAAAIAMPSVSLSGALNLIAGGAISQGGALSGTSLVAKTLLTGGAAISLSSFDNDFNSIDLRSRNGGDSANAAGALSYRDANGFDVAALASTSTLDLIAGGAMTQSGSMAGSALTAKTLNNTGAGITFNNSANALTSIQLSSRNAADTANAGGAISYVDSNAIDIAGLATTASASVTGTSISQSDAIYANSLSAKTLSNAGGAIALTNASNHVNVIDLRARNTADTANAAGVISYVDADGIDVSTISTTSTIGLTAGGVITNSGALTGTTLTLSSVGGAVLDFGSTLTGFTATNTTSGNIQLVNTGTLSVNNISQAGGGDFILNNTGTTTFNGNVNTATGNTSVVSTGAVTDGTVGAFNTNVLSIKTENNAGAAITLNNANLHHVSSILLRSRNAADTANAGGAIAFTGASGFDVAGIDTTSTLGLIASGNMTQSGAMTVGGTSTFDAGASNNITFDNSGNTFANVSITAGNDVTLRDSDTLNLATSTVSGDFTLTSGGDLTDSGNLNVAGSLIINAGSNNVTLNSTSNNFSSIKINSANNVTLLDTGGMNFLASTIDGALSATTTGAITQSGALLVGGSATFAAGTTNDITLNNTSNQLNSVGITTGRNVILNNAGALALNASTVSGTLNVTTQGALTQTGVLTVSGATTLDAGSNNIDLNTSNNNFSSVGIANGYDVSLRDTNGIILNTSTVANSLTVTAGNTITQSGALTVPTLSVKTLTNGGSAITLNNASNVISNVNLQTRNLSDTANASGAINFAGSGGFNITGISTTNSVTLVSDGAMTQSGAILGGALVARTENNSGANITLTDVNNSLSSANLQTRDASNSNDVGGTISYSTSGAIVVAGLRTTGNATLFSGGSITDSGVISVGNVLTTTSTGGLTLNSANSISGLNISNNGGAIAVSNNAVPLTLSSLNQIGGTVSFSNSDNIIVAGALETNGNSISFTTPTANLIVNNGASVHSSNGNMTISAMDLNLNNTGTLNAGTGSIAITGVGNIGLGSANDTMSISNVELQHMTANTLTLNAPTNGAITVNGAASNHLNSVILNATAGTTGSVTFGGASSTFNALTVQADNGITVNAPIITTVGNLNLNANVGNASANTGINLNSNLTSAGSLILSAQGGGIHLGAATTLTGNGITFNHAVDGAYDLTLNAGSAGNITFNQNVGAGTRLGVLNIVNLYDLINNATIYATSYNQSTGHLTNFGTQGLNLTNSASVIGNTVNGAVNVKALTLTVSYADLTGFVNGLSGVNGAKQIVNLNSISQGTHFFDGVDMYTNAPPPVPPAPPVPPSKDVATGLLPQIIQPYSPTTMMENTVNQPTTITYENKSAPTEPKVETIAGLGDCFAISDGIQMCAGG